MLTMKEEVFVRIVMDRDGMPVIDEVVIRCWQEKTRKLVCDIIRKLDFIVETWQRIGQSHGES